MARTPQSPYNAGPPDENAGPEKDEITPTSELEEMRQAIAELTRQREADRALTERITRELEENQALVSRLMSESNTIDLAAIATRRKNREEARRKIYDRVAGKKVVIQFHLHEDPRRNYPIHVNLNGKFYNIDRGRPFEIEGEFLEVLDHAYLDHITAEVNEWGNREMKHYDMFTYPYVVLNWPSDGTPETSDVIRAAA